MTAITDNVALIRQRIARQESYGDRLIMPFELRQKSRLRARLESGAEVGVFLDRGTILRGGDYLKCDDGRVVRVEAALEDVYIVKCITPQELMRATYHLGNRHVPLEVGETWLKLKRDAVLRDMLLGLGATVSEAQLPFEPEAGAYGGGHTHGDAQHRSIIHRHKA